MNILETVVLWTLHLAGLLFWPLVLVGVIRRAKALLTCRRGPPILQPVRDIAKLLRKREVLADTTTWVFAVTPWVSFAVVVVVGLMVPLATGRTPLAGRADLILLVYLFALDRFFRTVAAMDTGTAFGGLGASRESFVSTLAEPALVLSLWCVGILTGSLDLGEMVCRFAGLAQLVLSPVYLLVLLPLVLVALAENCRIPFDDPTTHLELTMIHEAMSLEYSGRGLALMEWASMMRVGIWLALIANLFFPAGLADEVLTPHLLVGLASFALRTVVLAVGVALVEVTFARLNFFRIPDLLGLAVASAVLALIRIVTLGR
ncbi:MAG: NADH-quinone oxidoreductase subunit H [Candidatus Riflebacteria bacterium]|nr:NADH-quinone oxidoreductase subunit H [Candidatus Riflebacteria bacterium]